MLKPQDKTRNHRLQYFSNTLQKKKGKIYRRTITICQGLKGRGYKRVK